MNRSQSAAAAAIARAESMPRPHTADLAVALFQVQMWVADYDRVSARCGGVWTAARLRYATRRLQALLDGRPMQCNAICYRQQYAEMVTANAATV